MRLLPELIFLSFEQEELPSDYIDERGAPLESKEREFWGMVQDNPTITSSKLKVLVIFPYGVSRRNDTPGVWIQDEWPENEDETEDEDENEDEDEDEAAWEDTDNSD